MDNWKQKHIDDQLSWMIGKVLTKIEVSDDRENIQLDTIDGHILAVTYAECCSYTWVENVELPALGFPAIITGIKVLDMPDVGDNSKYHTDAEELAFYGYKIETDKGEIVIDFRNDSNGYYGGDLYFHDRTESASKNSSV